MVLTKSLSMEAELPLLIRFFRGKTFIGFIREFTEKVQDLSDFDLVCLRAAIGDGANWIGN
jgi:hypothetical protein